jgi:hypothetical protein
MPGELCTLATFSDVVEASLVVNRLKDEGIPARLSSDMSGGLLGLGYALGGMDIIVSEDDLERALLVLEKMAAERDEPWERDVLPASALPVTVDPDDPERREAIQTARGTASEPRRVHYGPPADAIAAEEPAPDEPEEPTPPAAAGDRIVTRAFRAAMFGWLLGPLMPAAYVYSLILLLQTGSDDYPLSRGGTVKYYIALAIDLVAIGVMLMFVIALQFSLFW